MNVMQPLLDLQDIDGRVRELEQEIADIPLRQKQELSRLDDVNLAFAKAQQNLQDVQLKIRECQAEIDNFSEKIKQTKIAQTTMKTNKEFTASALQIKNFEDSADQCAKRQISFEDELPSLQKAVSDTKAAVDRDRTGIDTFCAELDERLKVAKEELAEAEKIRVEKARGLSPQFSLYYNRMRKKRWPVIVPLTKEHVCDGCHMVQPPSIAQMAARINKTGKLDRLVTCQTCGRILYDESDM